MTHQGKHIKADTSRGDTSSSQVFKGSSNQVLKVIGAGAISRTQDLQTENKADNRKAIQDGQAERAGRQGGGPCNPWGTYSAIPLPKRPHISPLNDFGVQHFFLIQLRTQQNYQQTGRHRRILKPVYTGTGMQWEQQPEVQT